jgi:hypothetical protein
MNKLSACLALAFVAPLFSSLYAQEGPPPEQYEPPPPVGMDVDYFAPTKQKLYIGFRTLSGPKVSFSGSGSIVSSANPGDPNDPTITTRTYNDGNIGPDQRISASSSNPVNQSTGTNTWNFSSAGQIDTVNNGVDMHTYGATINGKNPHSGRAASGTGFELTFERDFGWHIGKVQIDLIGGLGMNKISYSRTGTVAAMMTTRTDVFNTFNTIVDPVTGDPVLDGNGNVTYSPGVPANSPTAGSPPVTVTPPYVAPSSGTDSAGTSVDNSTIIGSQPVSSNTPAPQPAEVTEKWNITGAYFTLRAGAQITMPITEKFSANVSGGPALVYVGTTFSVNQTLTPPTGNPITTTVSDDYSTVLPAYFADANVEYALTDTTGLYLGAVFQSTTSYNQAIHSLNGNYANKVDFGNQEGVRGGISFKF